jgi:hypothetical protein
MREHGCDARDKPREHEQNGHCDAKDMRAVSIRLRHVMLSAPGERPPQWQPREYAKRYCNEHHHH